MLVSEKAEREFAGYGISYRPEFKPYMSELLERVQCVEVLLDEVFGDSSLGSECLETHLPIAAHGLSFSPASADFAMTEELSKVLARARHAGLKLMSEHLSFSSVQELTIPNFFAPSKTRQEAERVAGNVRRMAAAFGGLVAVENPVVFFHDPDDEMNEADFMNEVAAASGCELLLDVNNLYINSVNFGFDARDFLKRLQGERVAYLHVAGYGESDRLLLDTHGDDVSDAVWALAREALRETAARAVILERDNGSATRDEILSELDKLGEVWTQVRGV